MIPFHWCLLLFLRTVSAEPTELNSAAVTLYLSAPSAPQKTVAERPFFESQDFAFL